MEAVEKASPRLLHQGVMKTYPIDKFYNKSSPGRRKHLHNDVLPGHDYTRE